DEMETWFRRAMTADPDNKLACNLKSEWLQPKWHGTAEESAGFGLQCLRTRNQYAAIPIAAVYTFESELQEAHRSGKPVADATKAAVTACFRGHSAAYPADRWATTLEFRESIRMSDWAGAVAAADRLGTSPWPGLLKTTEDYPKLVELARTLAKIEAK
ncbi:MAG: hypothetical protein ACRDD1_10290, partial [Planctomycetia bacterium]